MAKEDVLDMPSTPPRKRRALKEVPDVWLAKWAASATISRADRARVQSERDERKHRSADQVVGLLTEREGVTPEQLAGIKDALAKVKATAIVQTRVPRQVHTAARAKGVPITVVGDQREVVQKSNLVIVAPRSNTPIREGCWEWERYARHRSIPTIVITPDWRG